MNVLEAQALVDRVAAVDLAAGTPDRDRVEAALREHFVRLGLEPLPVRWLPDAEAGYLDVFKTAREDAVAARSAAWSAARSAAWSAARSAAESAARSAAESAAWSAARSAAESAARSAAESAARSAAWSAAWSAAGSPIPAEIERWIGIWLPFIDAFEAGLWMFWICRDHVVAVPHPCVHMEDERVHREDGPAIWWPDGARYWFWRGVQVPQRVIEQANELTVQEITGEPNVEVRRVMLERIGFDRYLREAGARLLQEDDFGRLWRAQVADDEPLLMVEVVNSTVEPDGSYKTYFLRVPPHMRTARAALAWTFGVDRVRDYELTVES